MQIPDSDSLQADACGPTYRYDSLSRLVLERKEDMRRRGARSPDEWDAVALTFAQLEERTPKPLILILGMLRTKDAAAYIRPFKGLAKRIIAVTVPGEPNSFPAEELAQIARAEGVAAQSAASIEAAIAAARTARGPARILIAGSLYLAGNVLAAHSGEARSAVSGAIR